jgi:hypothetical protein
MGWLIGRDSHILSKQCYRRRKGQTATLEHSLADYSGQVGQDPSRKVAGPTALETSGPKVGAQCRDGWHGARPLSCYAQRAGHHDYEDSAGGSRWTCAQPGLSDEAVKALKKYSWPDDPCLRLMIPEEPAVS